MPRSLKKGPFVDKKLQLKVEKINKSGKKTGDKNLVSTFYDYP